MWFGHILCSSLVEDGARSLPNQCVDKILCMATQAAAQIEQIGQHM